MDSDSIKPCVYEFGEVEPRMPALFVGHGSPMNAVEDNEFSRAWQTLGQSLPKPKAILCISAHWETIGTRITAMAKPKTIHDFHGFPRTLFEVDYPAPGDPALAQQIREMITETPIALDEEWGLDHGTWSILCRMFPEANIPVLQLSLDHTQSSAGHYQLGQALQRLRHQGVLIMGSGNIVHNLGKLIWKDTAHEWAVKFDEDIKRLIQAGEYSQIIDYLSLGDAARLSIPTNEHFLPLLYILALREAGDAITFFAEKVTLGAISMRSLRVD